MRVMSDTRVNGMLTGATTSMTEVNITTEISDIRTGVVGCEAIVNDMMTGVTGSKTEVIGVKSEIKDFKTGVSGCKTEVIGIKSEITMVHSIGYGGSSWQPAAK